MAEVADSEAAASLPELAALEVSVRRSSDVFKLILRESKEVHDLTREAVGGQPGGVMPAPREVQRRLGERLVPVARRWRALAIDYPSSLADVDACVRALVARALVGDLQPADGQEVAAAFDAIRHIVEVTRNGRGLAAYADAALDRLADADPTLVRSLALVADAVGRIEDQLGVMETWLPLIADLPRRRAD